MDLQLLIKYVKRWRFSIFLRMQKMSFENFVQLTEQMNEICQRFRLINKKPFSQISALRYKFEMTQRHPSTLCWRFKTQIKCTKLARGGKILQEKHISLTTFVYFYEKFARFLIMQYELQSVSLPSYSFKTKLFPSVSSFGPELSLSRSPTFTSNEGGTPEPDHHKQRRVHSSHSECAPGSAPPPPTQSTCTTTNAALKVTIGATSTDQDLFDDVEGLCAICMVSFNNTMLACGHEFCEQCIFAWGVKHRRYSLGAPRNAQIVEIACQSSNDRQANNIFVDVDDDIIIDDDDENNDEEVTHVQFSAASPDTAELKDNDEEEELDDDAFEDSIAAKHCSNASDLSCSTGTSATSAYYSEGAATSTSTHSSYSSSSGRSSTRVAMSDLPATSSVQQQELPLSPLSSRMQTRSASLANASASSDGRSDLLLPRRKWLPWQQQKLSSHNQQSQQQQLQPNVIVCPVCRDSHYGGIPSAWLLVKQNELSKRDCLRELEVLMWKCVERIFDEDDLLKFM